MGAGSGGTKPGLNPTPPSPRVSLDNPAGRVYRLVLHRLRPRRELADGDVKIAIDGTVLRRPRVPAMRPMCKEQPDAGWEPEHGQKSGIRQPLAQSGVGITRISNNRGDISPKLVAYVGKRLLPERLCLRGGACPGSLVAEHIQDLFEVRQMCWVIQPAGDRRCDVYPIIGGTELAMHAVGRSLVLIGWRRRHYVEERTAEYLFN